MWGQITPKKNDPRTGYYKERTFEEEEIWLGWTAFYQGWDHSLVRRINRVILSRCGYSICAAFECWSKYVCVLLYNGLRDFIILEHTRLWSLRNILVWFPWRPTKFMCVPISYQIIKCAVPNKEGFYFIQYHFICFSNWSLKEPVIHGTVAALRRHSGDTLKALRRYSGGILETSSILMLVQFRLM